MHHYSDMEIDIVQDIVESSGSLFHPVSQNNYQGIHGIVEIIVSETPINISFGVHIVNAEDFLDEENKKYEISCKNFSNYFQNYSLPVVIVAIDNKTNEGYWGLFDNSKSSHNIIISSSSKSQFNFKSFNTVVIDFFLNKEKRLFHVESFLKENTNQELKSFLEVLFKVFDISIPWVLQYEYLDELIEAAGFTLIVSDKSILNLSNEIAFNGGGNLAGTHNYFQTHFLKNENILYCSPSMLLNLGEQYEKVQQLCS